VVVSTQAGQAVLVNFTASYEVMPQVHVGLNGYYLKQITQSKVDGIGQTNSETRVLGLGPGAFWDYSKSDKVSLSVYADNKVKSAPKFDSAVLRWVHIFQ
jgi:hypothetical protein